MVCDSQGAAELVRLTIRECYVYAPLPPCVAVGHRADDWNPEKWSKAVVLKVVTSQDDAWLRLCDPTSGDLFAECPLPNNGTSITTAVEPVTDSSRYFVLRIVDRESRNHAFIGLGFRDRGEASQFTAELDNFRQSLRRGREAAEMRRKYEEGEEVGSTSNSNSCDLLEEDAANGTSSGAAVARRRDLSLAPGQTIKIHLAELLVRGQIDCRFLRWYGGLARFNPHTQSVKLLSRLICAG